MFSYPAFQSVLSSEDVRICHDFVSSVKRESQTFFSRVANSHLAGRTRHLLTLYNVASNSKLSIISVSVFCAASRLCCKSETSCCKDCTPKAHVSSLRESVVACRQRRAKLLSRHDSPRCRFRHRQIGSWTAYPLISRQLSTAGN